MLWPVLQTSHIFTCSAHLYVSAAWAICLLELRLLPAVHLCADPDLSILHPPCCHISFCHPFKQISEADVAIAGLDARAAAIVMRCVRNTVNTGRTVVCTIHQPSIDIFEAFDDLLLMKSGGYVTYHGSLGKQSTKLIAYFEVS